MGVKQIRTKLLEKAFNKFHNGTAEDAESLVELLYEYTLPALSKPGEKKKLKLAKEKADLDRQKVFHQGIAEADKEHHGGAKENILESYLSKGDATYAWTLLQYLNRVLQKKGLIEE